MLKYFICFLISIMPLNFLRIFFYNKILGYKINYESIVKFLTILISDNCEIENSRLSSFMIVKIKKIKITNSKIKNFNIIKNFNLFEMHENSCIGKFNRIIGENKIKKDTSFIINKNVFIKNKNYIDLSDNVDIGEDVKIHSFCQLWTHGYTADRKLKIGSINIKKNCIINSGCLISQGVTIGENAILDYGSITTSNLENNKFYYHELKKK